MTTGSKGWDIELSGVWSGDQHIQRHIHEGVRGGNFGGEGDFGDAVRWRGEGFRDLSRLGLKAEGSEVCEEAGKNGEWGVGFHLERLVDWFG